MFLGFSAKFNGGGSVALIDWAHQPFGRGPNARPVAEDSALVTVQAVPRFPNGPIAQGPSLVDAYLRVVWSAAQHGNMICEMDLQRGVSFSVAATRINAEVVFEYNAPNNIEAVVEATVGRGTRPSFLDHPTRTRRAGLLAQNVSSAPLVIPYFARSFSLASSTAAPISAAVIQTSSGNAVQIDSVGSTQSLVTVNPGADSVIITNLSAVAQNLSAVFRIAL